MINVNDFKNGLTIKFNGNLYQVIEFQHVKPGKGAAFVRSKLKNLRTASTIDHTFNAGVKVETAHIDKNKMQFLYKSGDLYSFMDMNTYEQMELSKEQLVDDIYYLTENLDIEIVSYEGELLGINLPDKVALKITSSMPAVKGNTSSGAMKDATLETGFEIKVPLFIDERETILVSTKDGKYVSRA
ncbi:MAG: elongation factor P [Bacilli bacterium]